MNYLINLAVVSIFGLMLSLLVHGIAERLNDKMLLGAAQGMMRVFFVALLGSCLALMFGMLFIKFLLDNSPKQYHTLTSHERSFTKCLDSCSICAPYSPTSRPPAPK
jgi:hypothetical protein